MEAKLVKPQYLRLALLGVLGVALIVIGGMLNKSPVSKGIADLDTTPLIQYEKAMAREVERVVGCVRGVGKVSASVVLEAGPKSVFALNTQVNQSTQSEATGQGEIRQSVTSNTTSQPVIARLSGGDEPLIEKIGRPQVGGCLVVAQGAFSSQVKLEIYRAVETLLNIPLYKIQVLPMEGGK